MLNTIELQKKPNRQFYPHHTSMLFEGMADASSTTGPESYNNDDLAASEEMSATAGRNKLLTRDSFNMLMMFSLFIGFCMLVFSLWFQRKNKDSGHFYLPRPNKSPVVERGQKTSSPPSSLDDIQIGKYENTSQSGYIPLREDSFGANPAKQGGS